VSRERLPRAEKDLWSRHSERIARALELRQLDFLSYGALSFLVDKIALPGRNGEALYTLKELARTLCWPLEIDALRRRLHGLRDADWITFEDPRRGPEAPWIFRLTGAEVDAERDESQMSFDSSFLAGRPVREETISAQGESVGPSSPQPERVPKPSEFPRRARVEQSREETESKPLSEEELDHVLGKTTARVRVEQAEDGSLVWDGEPQKGEQGLLDDCQALVDAELATWLERPA
jgi:hypothetical protein